MSVTFRCSRRSIVRRSLLVAAVAGTLLPGVGLGSADAATAATLPSNLAKFANCPVGNPQVTLCLSSTVNSGTFVIGSETLDISSPLTLNLGLYPNSDGSFTTVAPDNGTPAARARPSPCPILSLPPLPGPLSITASTNLASLPTLDLVAFLTGKGTALSLPIYVTVNNTLIGRGCTIGTASAPVVLNLTTGKTNPPPPNKPIKGKPGTPKSTNSGILTVKGTTLVDNAFAVPGASGCGPLGALDLALDEAAGIPAAAGHNSAVLHSTTATAPASLVAKYIG